MTDNGRRIELQCLIFILSLYLILAPSAWGDYQDGRTAYNRGDLDIVKSKYLSTGFQTTGNGFFTSGQISDAIGYLHIASFSIGNGSAWVYEDIGIPPDIYVVVSPLDRRMARDPVIETAIKLLK